MRIDTGDPSVICQPTPMRVGAVGPSGPHGDNGETGQPGKVGYSCVNSVANRNGACEFWQRK